MAVKTIEELLQAVKIRVGEDTSEEALAFIEDVTDTYDSMDKQIKESGDWKSKYDDLSAKYKERFFSGQKQPEPDPDPEPEPKVPRTFDDLFKTVE